MRLNSSTHQRERQQMNAIEIQRSSDSFGHALLEGKFGAWNALVVILEDIHSGRPKWPCWGDLFGSSDLWLLNCGGRGGGR